MQERTLVISLFGYEHCAADKAPIKMIACHHMIHYIESGHGWYNGHYLGAGQGFVCFKNRHCHYYPAPDDPWTYTWFDLDGIEADRLIDLLSPAENGLFAWLPEDLPLLRQLCRVPFAKEQVSDELNRLAVLYRLISVSTARSSAVSQKNGNRYVEKACRYLESNCYRGVTVRETADMLHISRAYLRNLFQAEIGCSTEEYRMSLRMNRAADLLKKYSVAETAKAVGYTDPLQFSRIFKKHFKVSPTDYKTV